MGIEYVCERIRILPPKDPNISQIIIGPGGNYDRSGWKSGTELFVFRWLKGKEDGLADAIYDATLDRRTTFSWYDASVLTNKLEKIL